MNKELSKEEELAELLMQSESVQSSIFLIKEYAKKEAIALFRFAELASHSDWTYLPSMNLWYNEEDEENVTPKTTDELYELFKQQK